MMNQLTMPAFLGLAKKGGVANRRRYWKMEWIRLGMLEGVSYEDSLGLYNEFRKRNFLDSRTGKPISHPGKFQKSITDYRQKRKVHQGSRKSA